MHLTKLALINRLNYSWLYHLMIEMFGSWLVSAECKIYYTYFSNLVYTVLCNILQRDMTSKEKFENVYIMVINYVISVAADGLVPKWAPGRQQLL